MYTVCMEISTVTSQKADEMLRFHPLTSNLATLQCLPCLPQPYRKWLQAPAAAKEISMYGSQPAHLPKKYLKRKKKTSMKIDIMDNKNSNCFIRYAGLTWLFIQAALLRVCRPLMSHVSIRSVTSPQHSGTSSAWPLTFPYVYLFCFIFYIDVKMCGINSSQHV